MEALILLIAPLLEVLLAPVIAMAGAILGLLVELVFWLLALIFGGAWEARRQARKRAGDSAAKPWVSRKVLHWSAGILLGLGVLGLMATWVFFDPILRYGLARAEEKTGVEINYDAARGNLLAGRVALEGVTMRRAKGSGLDFDLSARQAEVNVALLTLLDGEVRIEHARVEGVRGRLDLPEKKEGNAGDVERREKRAFRIDDLGVKDVALNIVPRGQEGYPLMIAQAEVMPLRSRTALFDLLFRSNLQAEVAGQPLSVATKRITENGRETHWRFVNVEAAKLSQVMPRAPLTWLEDGRVTVTVDDRWSLSEDWIEMDWRVAFEGIEVSLPEGLPPMEAVVAKAFQKGVQAKGGNAAFRYKIELDQEQIALARDGDLEGFWKVLLTGFVKDSAKGAVLRSGEAAEEPAAESEKKGGVKGAVGKIKDLLKRD